MCKSDYKTRIGYFLKSLLLIPVMLLASCGGGGSSDPASTTDQQNQTDISSITNAQAESTAKSLIGGNLNNTIAAIGDIATNSPAVNTAAGSLGITIPGTTASLRSSHESSPTAAIEQQLLDALNLFFNSGTRSGDTITYDPDEVTMCNDAVLGLVPGLVESIDPSVDPDSIDTSDAITECIDLYEHVTMVLTILGEEQGTLDFKMYDFILITVGYSTDESYAQFDLAQFMSIIEAIGNDQDPPEDPELPSVFQGVVRLTNTVLGEEHGKVRLSIEQSINIVDDSEELDTSIEIAQTPKIFELEANGITNTASVEVALAAIELLFPIDDINDDEQQAELSINGLTLKADLVNDGNELVATNIGLGNAPLLFNVVDLTSFIITDDPEDLKLSLDNFGFTINGTDETITLTSFFDALLEIEDDFGIISDEDRFNGSVGIEINNGTVLTPHQSTNSSDPVFEITSGFVNQTGSKDSVIGGDEITFLQSFVDGDCITANPDAESSFEEPPFIQVECPLTVIQ